MTYSNFFRSNSGKWLALHSVFFLLSFFPAFSEVGLRLPSSGSPITSPLKPSEQYSFSTADPLDRIDVFYPRSARHYVIIDSLGQSVTVRRQIGEFNLLYPNTIAFNDYLSQRSSLQTYRLWQEYSKKNVTPRDQSRGITGLVLESPKIKSAAFRRVFGGETLKLKVTGEITIDGGMKKEKRDNEIKSAANRAPNTNFQMKQTQRFKVEGKIGENVTIDVDQDSERPFEFDNAMKLKYSSDEDGIVQSIEAGNIALSLPKTRFVSASQSSSGLFGIKTVLKIGGLDVTAIASVEKGEKKKLSFQGGASSSNTQIKDLNYKKGTYFFLDDIYRRQYIKGYNPQTEKIAYNPDSSITLLQVWLYTTQTTDEDRVQNCKAVFNPDSIPTEADGQYAVFGDFKKLELDKDYGFNEDLGYLYLTNSLSESQVIAVSYVIKGTGNHSKADTIGTIYSPGSLESPVFKLIRSKILDPNYPTWKLEWRNVYNLGYNLNTEGLELKIYYDPGSGSPRESWTKSGWTSAKGFLEIFGLDIKNTQGEPVADGVIDDSWYIVPSRGELIFPDLTPFDPKREDLKNLYSDSLKVSSLYNSINTDQQRQDSKFYIEVNSSSRDANINLGINVIENSEEVILDGVTLVRDQDYHIDYFSGSLTLISARATDPNAKLDINYESQQMFSIDKKTMLGIRAEYSLWERSGKNSFIGATFVRYSEKTMDQRIRITNSGQGSFTNMVWDVNTSLNFEPNFLTSGLQAIPFIHTSGKSSFAVEGEIAQILPNPNPLESGIPGDEKGVAYLDDFESSEREISVGVMQSQWRSASYPKVYTDTLSSRGHLFWYNPYTPLSMKDVWPERETSTQVGSSRDQLETLVLAFRPKPEKADDPSYNATQSWGGIMKTIPSGYSEQLLKAEYLDIWVQGNYGRLHIDMGQISEDIIPNGKWDTEDRLSGGTTGIRNGILDNDEDIGIDGMQGPDPPDPFYPHQDVTITVQQSENGEYLIASPYDFWDINKDRIKQPNEPWSMDDWNYASGSSDYTRVNGTEGNMYMDIAAYPDSEDMNGNKDSDKLNAYFSYSVSLSKSGSDTMFIAGGHDGSNENVTDPMTEALGWWLYRIPLKDDQSPAYDGAVGDPAWERVQYIRLWVDSVSSRDLASNTADIISPLENKSIKYARIALAEMGIVGSEWEVEGTYFEHDNTIQYNTDDTKTLSLEVVNTHDNPEFYNENTLPSGVQGEYDKVQQIRAREQSLVIKCEGLLRDQTAVARKTFNTDVNLIHYKKLRMFVHGGGQFHRLDDGDSVQFFFRWGTGSGDNNYYEVMIPSVYDGWDEQNNIHVPFSDLSKLKMSRGKSLEAVSDTLENGHIIRVKGNPSLTKIRWLQIGVKNVSPFSGGEFYGEIWINELRLTDVEREKAMAMRVRGEIALSDFITANAEYEKQDADYHTVNQRFGKESTMESFSSNISFSLHQLLPQSLGLRIPIRFNYSEQANLPKYSPGTDILVIPGETVSKAEEDSLKTLTINRGLSFNLDKTTNSRNLIVRSLVDPISVSGSYTKSENHTAEIKNSSDLSYNGSISYNLTFGKQNYVQPLKWMGHAFPLKYISDVKLYYLPPNVKIDLKGNQQTRNSVRYEGLITEDATKTLTRTFSTGYNPLQWLSSQYSYDTKSNMADADWSESFASIDPGEILSRKQNFSGKANPKFLSWLTPSYSYSANYTWTDNPALRNTQTGTSTTLQKSNNWTGTLTPDRFVKMFERNNSKSNNKKKTTLQKPKTVDSNNDTENQTQSVNEKEKLNPLSFLKVFGYAGNIFSRLEPVTVTYNTSQNEAIKAILYRAQPTVAYRFGFSDDPEVETNPDLTTANLTQTRTNTFSIKTGFSLTRQVKVTLSWDQAEAENRSSQNTGNSSQSIYLTNENHFIPFPNWTISWRGLEKLPLLNKFVRSASISHSFSGKETKSWEDISSNVTKNTKSKDYKPFLQFSFTLNNSITGNIQYQKGLDYSQSNQMTTKNTGKNITASGKYQKQGGIKIPFLKGKKLDNNIDVNLTLSYSDQQKDQKTTRGNSEEENKYVKISKTVSWSMKPQLNYQFSKTVTGGTYFEYGKRENLTSGKTTSTAFGINARIIFSGN